MKKIILAALLAATASPVFAVAPMWVSDVMLSPDGSKVAFAYKGDIYTVPVTGGTALRLTDGTAVEAKPVWSPDGKTIAFASDRNGGLDVYVMNADGSGQKRLTFNSAAQVPQNFTPDGKSIIFTAVIEDPAQSALGPVKSMSEIYSVPVTGGRYTQIVPVAANNIRTIPASSKIVYEGVKGGEDKWRKHHTSSITRDLWTYDSKDGKFINLTNHAGEDRDPAPSADGNTLFFLSERDGGSFNVYAMPAAGGAPKALTSFTTHPVRYLSRGGNDLLAFTYNGELYTMTPGGTPSKLNIQIADADIEEPETISFSRGSGAVVSPDGEQLAFTNRGEVFVTSVKYPSTKQITHTPAIEEEISWGKDGKTLYYTSRRNGKQEIYRAKIARGDDPNFSNATLIEEEPMFKDDGKERNYPVISPDGKKMAFLEDRNILKVMDLASKKVTTLTPEPVNNYRNGNYNMAWSPDSRWLALEVMNPLHEPYTDIAIINASTAELIPLTKTGYFDGDPVWSPDGNAILFSSERFGMRNHASWGSQNDVMMIFLNKEAYDRFRLSEEDFALLKDVEKQQKKNADAKDKNADAKGKKGKKDDAKGAAPKEDKSVKIDREGIEDRIVRLTPNSSNLGAFTLSKDGETLYYIASFEKGADLWKKDLRKGDVSLVKKIGGRVGRLQRDNDGNIFLAGAQVQKFDPKSKELKRVDMSGKMKLDRAKEREAMLDYVELEAQERFLLPEMPVDWKMYVDNYRRFLPHINNNYDFGRLLSELLGELNVSHSGGRFHAAPAKESTASLGLIFDQTYEGDGRRVSEIVAGGPFDRATTRLKAGDIITSINGEKITADSDWSQLLNGITGKKTLVGFKGAAGESEEVILPISSGAMSDLLYERWVKGREQLVDSLSGGRLGYVHIRSMSDDSFRTIYAKVMGEYIDKDGIVIDTRWNGGGRLHEDIEVLFSGEKYLTQEIHGRKSAEFPSRRWNRPSIMVTGEANYSNAHGTPWVYQHKKMGKVVGMPVPGTMSSVNWITLQDPQMVFGIPVVAFRTNEGVVLENTQLEPDIKVDNLPADVIRGIDSQIETAVKELLKEIDAK
ncbi:MAG: PDZ domain-containing protein [Muribaculaceae bacterium]|nr:PDZ domain-containing protein [Muribaculaceae bacterium]